MKLTITQVTHYPFRKDGTPLIDKRGQSYMRAVIRAKEYGTQQLSGFVYKQLTEGQEIDAEVKDEEYNGETRKKFQITPPKAMGVQNLDWLKAEIVLIKRDLTAIRETLLRMEPEQEPQGLDDEFPGTTDTPF